MKFFLISYSKIFLILIIIGLITWVFPPLGLLLLLFLFIVLFILRKKNFLRASLEQWSEKIFLSPISGKILKIKEGDQIEVLIKVGIFSGWGFYLPVKSRVLNFMRKPREREYLPLISRKKEKSLEKTSSTVLEFESHRFYYSVEFWNRNLFSQLTLNVDTGDIGVSGASIGVFFGGGLLKLVLPGDFKLLIEENMKIKAVKTLIAKL